MEGYCGRVDRECGHVPNTGSPGHLSAVLLFSTRVTRNFNSVVVGGARRIGLPRSLVMRGSY